MAERLSEAQRVALEWMQNNGGEVNAWSAEDYCTHRTIRALLRKGLINDDGRTIILNASGRAALSNTGER